MEGKMIETKGDEMTDIAKHPKENDVKQAVPRTPRQWALVFVKQIAVAIELTRRAHLKANHYGSGLPRDDKQGSADAYLFDAQRCYEEAATILGGLLEAAAASGGGVPVRVFWVVLIGWAATAALLVGVAVR